MSENIDDYLAALPDEQRSALQHLRELIASTVPEAEEGMSTKVPAFRYKGRYLVSFSATPNHLALLVMQGNAMKAFAAELAPYETGSRIIRFTPEQPLPDVLIEKIVRYRQAEIDN